MSGGALLDGASKAAKQFLSKRWPSAAPVSTVAG